MGSGPLAGARVLELTGVGPGPFAATMLADLGADVIRLDRASVVAGGPDPIPVPPGLLNRSRRALGIDLKNPGGVELLLELVERADALIEPFRPGVMERLGVGPEVCLERNPKLIYCRMTGWGQEGPLAHSAGHDINYIALAGFLGHIGPAGQPPVPPIPLVGDLAGCGMFGALGIVAGLFEARGSGKGQVIDASVVDGTAYLMTMYHGFRAMGIWNDQRGTNFSDTGAHFYNVYECADGEYITIGAYETSFYQQLLEALGIADEPDLPAQHDRDGWPEMTARLEKIFCGRTRDEWCELMEGTDICFAPVLSMAEAPRHPHNLARNTFVEVDGVVQPAPAPRFSRTPGAVQRPPAELGQHTDEVLREWLRMDTDRISALRHSGAVA